MPTTIKLHEDTKALLDKENQPQESYDQTVRRLLGESKGDTWTKAEIEEVVREVIHAEF